LLWGIGGLTFGLSIRYLGIALGYAIALGFTTAFGTLMPPLFAGEMPALIHHLPGQVILFGIAVCMLGIVLSGMAGYSKERELSTAEKEKTVAEFNYPKGILVAVFAGVMSACFAYGLDTGKPIGALTKISLLAHGGALEWQNLPILIVVLLGGLTTNVVWCLVLMARNRTAWQIFQTAAEPEADEKGSGKRANLLANYLLCASVGTMWYLQFFFYSIGETKMGKYDFSSWTLHMASIIIFSTLWGIWLKEWSGVSGKTKVLVGLGLAVLVLSTIIVGYGNFLNVNVAPVS
jgi:L-rhamnose-H+ transport protein